MKQPKPDPKLPFKFAHTVLTELAYMHGELIAQRKLLIELHSLISKEPRRKIKDRTLKRRHVGMDIQRQLRERAGIKIEDILPDD